MKKIYILWLFFALTVVIALSTHIFAVESGVYTICDFSEKTDINGWKGAEATSGVREAVFDSDGNIRNCLEVIGKAADTELIREAVYTPSKPLSLEKYRSFSFLVRTEPFESVHGEYFIRLRLSSKGGDDFEEITRISGGEWTKVNCDIGGWSGRNSVSEVRIGLVISSSEETGYDKSFYIDRLEASDIIDGEMVERFLFDRFSVSGGKAVVASDKSSINITLSPDSETVIEAKLSALALTNETNSIRIGFVNLSDIDSAELFYSTYDSEAQSEYKRTEFVIDDNFKLQYCYADVGDVSMLNSIRLVLPAAEGSISIVSICAVSSYESESHETVGSVNSCTLSKNRDAIRFTGEVNRDEVLENRDGSIEIYAVDPFEAYSVNDLHSIEPIIRAPMTTRFDLSYTIKSGNEDIIHSKFIAVIVHADGKINLIADAFYVDNPQSLTKTALSAPVGKKGVYADDISLVGECSADATVISVDFGRLFSYGEGAEIYLFDGEKYSFDKAYLTALNRRITSLVNSGIGVLIRLNGWYQDYSEIDGDNASAPQYYTEYSSYEYGDRFFEAVCDYACCNWCGSGGVYGVILGEGENFCGDCLNLNEMVARTATGLSVIFSRFSAVNPNIKIYLSVSDLLSEQIATGSGEIELERYLPALKTELDKYRSFSWGVSIEKVYRFVEVNGEIVESYDCNRLISLLDSLKLSSSEIIFCDRSIMQSALKYDEVLATVVRGYLAALFNDRIDCYIVKADSSRYVSKLISALKELDTAHGDEIIQPVLDYFGYDSFSEVIKGYDRRNIQMKNYNYALVSYTSPSVIKGTYPYYVYNTYPEGDGFAPSYFCTEQTVDIVNGVLKAKLDSTAYLDDGTSKYMGISRRYEYPESFVHTPVLAITLRVIAPDGIEDVPVSLELDSGSNYLRSEATVKNGEMTTLYLHLNQFRGIDSVECMHIYVKSDDITSCVLELSEISGISTEYNDESLAKVIEEERMKAQSPSNVSKYRVYIYWGVGLFVVITTVLIFVLLSVNRNDNGKDGKDGKKKSDGHGRRGMYDRW